MSKFKVEPIRFKSVHVVIQLERVWADGKVDYWPIEMNRYERVIEAKRGN